MQNSSRFIVFIESGYEGSTLWTRVVNKKHENQLSPYSEF